MIGLLDHSGKSMLPMKVSPAAINDLQSLQPVQRELFGVCGTV